MRVDSLILFYLELWTSLKSPKLSYLRVLFIYSSTSLFCMDVQDITGSNWVLLFFGSWLSTLYRFLFWGNVCTDYRKFTYIYTIYWLDHTHIYTWYILAWPFSSFYSDAIYSWSSQYCPTRTKRRVCLFYERYEMYILYDLELSSCGRHASFSVQVSLVTFIDRVYFHSSRNLI